MNKPIRGTAAHVRAITAADPESRSADLVNNNIAELKRLFPEAVTEGRIDFEVLKSLLGTEVDEREEKYGLNWHGKRRARQLALTPSAGTLRPCPEESVDWDTTKNLMIEGDNLEVLKLLQKSYAGKVKLIYIDPPYNTGKDFVYPDNFQDSIKNYLELTGQVEGGQKISSNTDASGRFHTDWLNMMYPRLKAGRALLRQDGVLFVSIDDAESANVRSLCNEIFGEENFLATFVRRRRMATGMRDSAVSPDHEYVIGYAKNIEAVRLYGFERQASDFPFRDGVSHYRSTDLTIGMTKDMRPNQHYALRNPKAGTEYWPPVERVWRFEPATMNEHVLSGNIIWPDDNPGGRMSRPRFKTRYFPDDPKTNPVSTWISLKTSMPGTLEDEPTSLQSGLNQEGTKELRELLGSQVLEYPKPLSLLHGLISISTKKSDLVVDFFAGSGTTGHATWLANASDGGARKFILVQLPEPTGRSDFRTIAEITKERLRRAGVKLKGDNPQLFGDIGFKVFKLASSNIRAWQVTSENMAATLIDHAEHLVEGRSEHDVLCEILLKLGLELEISFETRMIAGRTIHNIGAGTLFVCLSDGITREVAEPLALGIAEWQKSLSPAGGSKIVFKDSAFADDVAKTNLAAILGQHGLDDVRSL